MSAHLGALDREALRVELARMRQETVQEIVRLGNRRRDFAAMARRCAQRRTEAKHKLALIDERLAELEEQ